MCHSMPVLECVCMIKNVSSHSLLTRWMTEIVLWHFFVLVHWWCIHTKGRQKSENMDTGCLEYWQKHFGVGRSVYMFVHVTFSSVEFSVLSWQALIQMLCDTNCAWKTSMAPDVFLFFSGEKPYTCEICWEKFARSDVLGQHRKKHGVFTRPQCWTSGQCSRQWSMNSQLPFPGFPTRMVYISSMIYSRDTPFWLRTLDLFCTFSQSF